MRIVLASIVLVVIGFFALVFGPSGCERVSGELPPTSQIRNLDPQRFDRSVANNRRVFTEMSQGDAFSHPLSETKIEALAEQFARAVVAGKAFLRGDVEEDLATNEWMSFELMLQDYTEMSFEEFWRVPKP